MGLRTRSGQRVARGEPFVLTIQKAPALNVPGLCYPSAFRAPLLRSNQPVCLVQRRQFAFERPVSERVVAPLDVSEPPGAVARMGYRPHVRMMNHYASANSFSPSECPTVALGKHPLIHQPHKELLISPLKIIPELQPIEAFHNDGLRPGPTCAHAHA